MKCYHISCLNFPAASPEKFVETHWSPVNDFRVSGFLMPVTSIVPTQRCPNFPVSTLRTCKADANWGFRHFLLLLMVSRTPSYAFGGNVRNIKCIPYGQAGAFQPRAVEKQTAIHRLLKQQSLLLTWYTYIITPLLVSLCVKLQQNVD